MGAGPSPPPRPGLRPCHPTGTRVYVPEAPAGKDGCPKSRPCPLSKVDRVPWATGLLQRSPGRGPARRGPSCVAPRPSPLLPYGPVIETHSGPTGGLQVSDGLAFGLALPCPKSSHPPGPASASTAGLQPNDQPASPQEISTARACEGLPVTKDTSLPAGGAPRTQDQATRFLLSSKGPDGILQPALELGDGP